MVVLWILAAHDKGKSSGEVSKCYGCYKIAHDDIADSWEYFFRDPYFLLVIFSAILLAAWTLTGILGLLAKTAFTAALVLFPTP